MLFEFKDLAYAIRSLSVLLSTINEKNLDEKKLKKNCTVFSWNTIRLI